MSKPMPTVFWDDAELPFVNSPSTIIPPLTFFRSWAAGGLDLRWNNKGLVMVIPNAVLRNALDELDAWNENRHLREKVPTSIGKFTWGQTISLDKARELQEAAGDTAAEPTRGDKADQ
jgi:hypothetical protein